MYIHDNDTVQDYFQYSFDLLKMPLQHDGFVFHCISFMTGAGSNYRYSTHGASF